MENMKSDVSEFERHLLTLREVIKLDISLTFAVRPRYQFRIEVESERWIRADSQVITITGRGVC